MYGTIFNVKVKPEGWEELRRLSANEPQPQGAVGMMVFQMDAEPCEIYTVAIAESEKAYRAISENPQTHETYLERRQLFESDPEWHDGRVVMFQHNAGSNGAQLYGTIAEMHLKAGALEALQDMEDGDRQPEGAVALCLFQMDADPNQVFMVAISESEAAYRAYSESEDSHQRYLEMMKWLTGEPRWHDGRVLEYQVLDE